MSMLSLAQYTCDNPSSVSFSHYDYMGEWYLHKMSTAPGEFQKQECLLSEYSSIDGTNLSVYTTFQSLLG